MEDHEIDGEWLYHMTHQTAYSTEHRATVIYLLFNGLAIEIDGI